MKKGDHLVVHFGNYTHHGIDMGDGRVIHYGRGLHNKINARVEIVTREVFSHGKPIELFESASPYSADEIIQRATGRLNENAYDVFDNNCEHFVNWCRLGVANSQQVNVVETVCRRGTATIAKIALPKVTSRFVLKDVAAKVAGRFALPAALAGDAVQFSAEMVAIRKGLDHQTTKELGRRSGALASSGVGLMLGGPVGAAAGLGSWLFGELLAESATNSIQQATRLIPLSDQTDDETCPADDQPAS